MQLSYSTYFSSEVSGGRFWIVIFLYNLNHKLAGTYLEKFYRNGMKFNTSN